VDSSEARRNFKTSPQAALQPYVRLQSLSTAVKAAQPAAEGAAPHLVDYVEKSATVLWKQMKDAFGGVRGNTGENELARKRRYDCRLPRARVDGRS
jgi:hypothetical protein